MKPAAIRLYRDLHSWAGLICGLLLFVAFYAGAITMFKQPLAAWAEPPGPGVRLDAAPALIEQVLVRRPEAAEELTLQLGDAGEDARLGWFDPDSGDYVEARATPDGGVAAAPPPASSVARTIDLIHRAGGLPGDRDLSLIVMGGIAVLYFLAIVSGLILVLPTLARDLFALRVGRNLKRMWLDAHNVVGVVSLPFHLFIATTVVIFAFGAPILDLQDRLIYGGRLDRIAQLGDPFVDVKPSGVRAPMLPPAQLLARVRAAAPGFEPDRIVYLLAGDRNALAMVGGHDPAHVAAGTRFARVGAVDGEILDLSALPGHGNAWGALAGGFAALHFGSFGGAPVRWAYFLLGLGGAFLFYSGNLIWIESRRRRAQRAPGGLHGRSVPLMASLTVGVAYGCITGISLSIAAAKWLYGFGADPGAWHLGLYYGAFVLSLAWAVVAGAARSVVGLMATAAVATAAIPAASLAAATVPALGLWNHPGPPLGVDLVAAGGAIALALGARTTRRRIARAQPDSVWFRHRPAAAPQAA